MTPIEFAECIAVLSAGVGRPMPEQQAAVWFEVLGDLKVIQLRGAVVRALKEHKFAGFPPVGVLRDYAGCGVQTALPANDRAVIAWDAVVRTIRDEGAYRTVQFDDPAVTAAVRSVGGWMYLCDLESEALFQFTKPRFLEAYRAYCNAGVRAIAAEPLTGILAADAGRDGYDAPPVVEVETGLPTDVKVIGEVRHAAIESAAVKRLEGALPVVEAMDLLEFVEDKPPHKPVPSADEQKAALAAKFGL